eukprot:TRINITY_DN1583_c0_g1_i1.p1 TRINITY_DN1583_c0_g1~~TRINITY_DN1583_c0_g1_i1.p1  ORF type:complete len:231 (-),score=56.27 TRINITY_DN1583_c0_g1_i1:10-702(-)
MSWQADVPKKPPSAYALYASDIIPSLKQLNPELSPIQLRTKTIEKWSNESDEIIRLFKQKSAQLEIQYIYDLALFHKKYQHLYQDPSIGVSGFKPVNKIDSLVKSEWENRDGAEVGVNVKKESVDDVVGVSVVDMSGDVVMSDDSSEGELLGLGERRGRSRERSMDRGHRSRSKSPVPRALQEQLEVRGRERSRSNGRERSRSRSRSPEPRRRKHKKKKSKSKNDRDDVL